MICTEEQAWEKRCPFMQPDQHRGRVTCIGPACMAWRWIDPVMNVRPNGPLGDLPDAYRAQDNNRPAGYCGAAGPLERG